MAATPKRIKNQHDDWLSDNTAVQVDNFALSPEIDGSVA